MEAPDPNLHAQLDFLKDVRDLAAAGSWKKGATKLYDGLKHPRKFDNEEKAQQAVRDYLFGLMETDQYLIASALAWDRAIFEQRPAHLKRIFDALAQHDLVILMGCSGVSKSYAAVAKLALDFFRDPIATAIKIAAVNDRNLRGNLWANILAFTDNFLFPVPLKRDDPYMALSADKSRPDCGVSSVLFGRKQDSTGKIKGVHPKPFRGYTHPRFGNLTCVRILFDEVNTLTEGVKKDLGSPLSTIDPLTHVMQIILTLNPDDEKNWAVELARPRNGWVEHYIDTHYDWVSVHGWYVCRLDGARFENVVQRKIIYPGFLTFEGYRRPLYGGTEPTAEFTTYSRGWPPTQGSTQSVVSGGWFDQALGEPIFSGKISACASLDPSAAGDNRSMLAVGRYGVAIGWRTADGQEYEFINRKVPGQSEERHCLVVDNLIRIFAKDPVSFAQEVVKWCEKLQIASDYFAVDETGPGHGVMSVLRASWGPVVGIHWAESATEMKILAEDREGACWQVDKRVSEMYWTIRQWINPIVRGFFVNPAMQPEMKESLKYQLTSRAFKYRQKDDLAEVEPKRAYVARGLDSPDEADAVAQLTFIPRIRGLGLPALIDEHAVASRGKGFKGRLLPTKKYDLADVTDTLDGVGPPPDEAPTGTTVVRFRDGYELL